MKTLLAAAIFVLLTSSLFGQSLGNAGTIEGVVVDPSGAAVPKAQVTIHNPSTGYEQSALSASDGSFKLINVPPNPYHLEVKAPGFSAFSREVVIRNSLPIQVTAALALAGTNTTVVVEGAAEALQNDPTAHVDVDRRQLLKTPA